MLGPPAHLCGLDQNRQWLCTRRRGLGRGLISDIANEGLFPTPLETRRTVCLDSFWHIACVLCAGTDLHGMDRSWPGKYLNHMDRSWAPVEFSGVLNSSFFGKDLFA